VVNESRALLEIDDLHVEIAQGDRIVRPLDGVSLALRPREALGLVG
jgi:ABC-type dipeptide/oligopeptide/nickel transport system ATPase component